MINSNNDALKSELKYDSEGNIIYSRDLFLILASGELNDVIIEYPELLDIMNRGVSDLFNDWADLDTALTISVMTLIRCAIANGVQELFGLDLTNIGYVEAETAQGKFADTLSKMIPIIIDLAKKSNKELNKGDE